MIVPRRLNIANLLKYKSHFLFGPRQTGKTCLLRTVLPEATYLNLLELDTYADLSAKPQLLRQRIQNPNIPVIIDEVQKLPNLLDEVHNLIESKGVKFLLTGSSARSITRKGATLLGGRARSRLLHPFSWSELQEHFRLDQALSTGLLPGIYFSDDRHADLKAYAGDYLKEEIAAEGAVRNIPSFSRFLSVAGYCHGKLINYEKVANDSRVASSTVRTYFQVLRDTYLGYNLEPWRHGSKRKEVATNKFYFFDNGVAQYLQNRRELAQGTPEFGDAFEAFIFHELKTYIDYEAPSMPLSFWRTSSGIEVDFIINDSIAIEVKASTLISSSELKGLKAIQEESTDLKRFFVVCLEPISRRVDGIEIIHYAEFLKLLWSGNL